MDQSITRKDVSHSYIVVVTQGPSVSRYLLQSNPEAVVDDVQDILTRSIAKLSQGQERYRVEYQRLGQGVATVSTSGTGGRKLHTVFQAMTYSQGYHGGNVTRDGLEDLSWLGQSDAELDRDRADEARAAAQEARAER